MADLSDYTTFQQKVMTDIVSYDKGFHTSFMIADNPFYGMMEVLDNGETAISKSVSCSLNTGGTDYTLELHYSEEQKCWFYLFAYSGEEIRGIVHYNTVLNAKGELAFVILNDSTEDADITLSLPYSNIFVMRR